MTKENAVPEPTGEPVDIDKTTKGARLVTFIPTGSMEGYVWPEEHDEKEAIIAALNRLHSRVLWYKQTLLASGPAGADGKKSDEERDVLEIIDKEPVSEQRTSRVVWAGDFIQVKHTHRKSHDLVHITVWPHHQLEEGWIVG